MNSNCENITNKIVGTHTKDNKSDNKGNGRKNCEINASEKNCGQKYERTKQ